MEDLSHLCPVETALTGGASMSAGNTISAPPPPGAGGAPGSVPANPPMKGMQPDSADLDIGPVISYVKKVG